MKLIKFFLFVIILNTILAVGAFAQATTSISGTVTDTLGEIVVGATVTAVPADGSKPKSVVTNAKGEYTISGLTPGKYTIKTIAPKFALYENAEVVVAAGAKNELAVILTVGGVEATVDVSNDNKVSTDPENNTSAMVIKDKDLDALPDDPDELQAALQALAGPAAGPNGGQIYVDGFTGGQLPPKDSIREIRINANPFSAEFDRIGFGRIEIFTKPGTDKFRGSVFGNFNDESLNSRNPFALNRAPSQTRFFGGNLSGPIIKGKASFFIDVSDRDIDTNSVVNAIILDPTLNPVNFNQDITVPTRRFSVAPRIDWAINAKNTLVARYTYTQYSADNQGIGGTSLPSRAYKTGNTANELRLTETMIINPKTVNETRFEYSNTRTDTSGDNTQPGVDVSSYFTGGSSQVGTNFTRSQNIELNNFTSTSFGKNMQHSVKIGGKIRHVNINDQSESNFGGSFAFDGVQQVTSPAGCDPATAGCTIVTPAVLSIDQYRQKLLGNANPIYNPTQFTISTGQPLAAVSQLEGALFATDDWKISPGLTLSFGMRYENQTNLHSNLNFAPRFGYAWSPGAGGAKAPKTVFRGGGGVFYDRFSENYTLQAERFNGTNELSLIVSANESDPVRRAAALALLAQPVFTPSGVTNVPTAAQVLAVLPQSSTIRQIAPTLVVPYTVQGAFGVERQLTSKISVTAYYVAGRTFHQLRIRDINAPICPLQVNCATSPRPQPTLGDIYQYESTGVVNQNQFISTFRATINTKFTLQGNYRLGFVKSSSDGAGSFPAYSYDLNGEYGRSSNDIRHSFTVIGNITLPWSVSLNPFVIARTGGAFNITDGVDLNGDSLFTERPTFGALAARCTQLNLTNSFCDVSGKDLNAIIPRNYGQSPAAFIFNMRVSKNFGFGGTKAAPVGGAPSGGQGGGRQGGIPGGGMPGGRPGGGGDGGRGGFGGGGFGGGDVRKPYNLNIGLSFNNILNNVNFNPPVGNLISSRFGQYTSSSSGFGNGTANRKIELQMRFSF